MTLPADVRRKLGLHSGDVVAIEETDTGFLIKPVDIADRPGSRWLKQLYDELAPAREEAAQMDEATVNAAIDSAVRAARRRGA